jgi:hypothetical protein
MSNPETITVHVVRRLGWEYGDDFYYRTEAGDAPLETYLDRARAESRVRELSWEYVRDHQVNPFGWVDASLEERSSLPPAELLERLERAGMRIEGGGDDIRFSCWEQYAEELDDDQRRLVLEALDRLCFFEVVEMSVEVEG